ncbi:MarR family transcriptional regulator [Amycolatopsis sp. QT-25]|uniref:MarR family winged helix-turn-helix transcriptional regulator n=1 Tax=Amycolatopsis sp. QT-25 TaxID=3034022 RepID=UPI0023ECC362|nr:MarR family transcriptional regulator [Amycolatopsis sp. QT-25]WET76274.1 MarR family transcriptional regulator [Amycolatopsis sp. QT-25]
MSTTVRWLTADEERAWRAFLRITVTVQTGTARDLAERGLSEADYEVLSTLSERAENTSSLGEQADKMGWSRSRLSRHATRMETRGLLRRSPDPKDGRGCLLTLTDDGLSVLEEVAPAHLASVRHHFMDHLTRGHLDALVDIARRLDEANKTLGTS